MNYTILAKKFSVNHSDNNIEIIINESIMGKKHTSLISVSKPSFTMKINYERSYWDISTYDLIKAQRKNDSLGLISFQNIKKKFCEHVVSHCSSAVIKDISLIHPKFLYGKEKNKIKSKAIAAFCSKWASRYFNKYIYPLYLKEINSVQRKTLLLHRRTFHILGPKSYENEKIQNLLKSPDILYSKLYTEIMHYPMCLKTIIGMKFSEVTKDASKTDVFFIDDNMYSSIDPAISYLNPFGSIYSSAYPGNLSSNTSHKTKQIKLIDWRDLFIESLASNISYDASSSISIPHDDIINHINNNSREFSFRDSISCLRDVNNLKNTFGFYYNIKNINEISYPILSSIYEICTIKSINYKNNANHKLNKVINSGIIQYIADLSTNEIKVLLKSYKKDGKKKLVLKPKTMIDGRTDNIVFSYYPEDLFEACNDNINKFVSSVDAKIKISSPKTIVRPLNHITNYLVASVLFINENNINKFLNSLKNNKSNLNIDFLTNLVKTME